MLSDEFMQAYIEYLKILLEIEQSDNTIIRLPKGII